MSTHPQEHHREQVYKYATQPMTKQWLKTQQKKKKQLDIAMIQVGMHKINLKNIRDYRNIMIVCVCIYIYIYIL
jgi:hypothetical protein